MNPEIKTKWVKALRNGEYRKGRSQLRIGDRFCCLGVLCDIHAKEFSKTWDGEVYIGEQINLPSETFEWAGLDSEGCPSNPIIQYNGQHVHLSALNDNTSKTFPEIAEIIDQQL